MNLASPPGGLFVSLLLLALAAPALARERVVGPGGDHPDLGAALAAAGDGDVILVRGGVHRGPFKIERRVVLQGEGWPVLDGGGKGNVLQVVAGGAGTVIRGLVVRRSGDSLDQENAGIAVDGAADVTIERNRLEETLFGIYLRKSARGVIRENAIASLDLEVPRRGDAIRVWFSDGVTIEDNRCERGRDVVLWYSARLKVTGNVVHSGRYGLHFMYCDDADIRGNRLSDNSVGAFLMYSRRLRLRGNALIGNRGPSGFGVGLKDMDDAVIADNLFSDNRVGISVDTSPREFTSTLVVEGNLLVGNDVGVMLQPLAKRNVYRGNSFVDNDEQVGLTGGGTLAGNTWEGNFWSDYAGFDADRDGVGDVPYRADKLFEDLVSREPRLRLFVYSPAADAVDLAARAFPVVRPQPRLTDPAPLTAPVVPGDLPLARTVTPGPLVGAALALVVVGVLMVFLPAWRRRAAPAAGPAPGAAGGDAPLAEVTGLTKRFGELVAVRSLSFSVRPGQAVALWGPNGAGKTTAVRCLLGVLPCEGELRIGGHDVRRRGKEARRLVGFVPQELSFHDDLTVDETLDLYARLRRAPLEPVAGILERLGLGPHREKQVRELSGGLKQRLALAVALLGDPPLLVLDEPTSNLDTRARAGLLGLLIDLKAAGKALVFSSHRREEVTALADQVLVLEQGSLLAAVPPHELGSHLARRTLLHVVLSPEDTARAADVLRGAGHEPRVRGPSVWVEVDDATRGRPIAALVEAGIRLVGFELEERELAVERSEPGAGEGGQP